ncbi:MAG: tetratricopeptide repeat protein [Planctomycetales bacterium]
MNGLRPRALAWALIFLTGCSSSGLFSGRGAPGASPAAGAGPALDARGKPRNRSRQAATKGNPPRDEPPADDPQRSRKIAELLKGAAHHEESNDLAAARIAYEQVLTLDRMNEQAHHQLAILDDIEERYAEAERHYQLLLAADPQNADVLASLGWSYILQGRYEESEQTLRDALAVSARHQKSLYNLGMLYGRKGDYDKALGIFRAAGDEQATQQAMAELFPNGRPTGNPQLARTAPRNPFGTGTGPSSARLGGPATPKSETRLVAAPSPRKRGTPPSSRETRPARAQARAEPARADVESLEFEEFDEAFQRLGQPSGRPAPKVVLTGDDSVPEGATIHAHAEDDQPLGFVQPAGHEDEQAMSGVTFPEADNRPAPRRGSNPANPPRRNAAPPAWPFRPNADAAADAVEPPPAPSRKQLEAAAARIGLSAVPGGVLFPLAPPSGTPAR